MKRRVLNAHVPVSVIMPCYNNGKTIEAAVNSLYRSYDREKIDLIIINDGSTDGSRQIIGNLQRKYKFTFINSVSNLGKAAAINKCSDRAKHDVLLISDADMVINPNSLNDCLARLQDRRVGAVSCPYRAVNKGIFALLQSMEYNFSALCEGSNNIFSGVSLWGGFIVIKKKAFFQAGRFSSNSLIEDMDMAFKLNLLGWKVRQSFVPVYTNVPVTLKAWLKQKIRWSSGNIQCFIKYIGVWTKNPVDAIFVVAFQALMFITALNLVISLLAPAHFIEGIIRNMPFTAFSLPFAIPLINKISQIHRIFLAIPFSVIYAPMFSLVYAYGLLVGVIKYGALKSEERAW